MLVLQKYWVMAFLLFSAVTNADAQVIMPIPPHQSATHFPCYGNPKVVNRQLLVSNPAGKCGNYSPYLIKGVGYDPAPIGTNNEWGYPDPSDPRPDNILDDPAILNRDFPLIRAMNANTIRIWGGDDIQQGTHFPIKITQQTLDLAQQYGLKVIAGFRMPWPGNYGCSAGASTYTPDLVNANFNDPVLRQNIKNKFRAFVHNWKNHPAVLFWAIGNENNLGFGPSSSPAYIFQRQLYYSLVNEMAQEARLEEGSNYHPVAIVEGDISSIGNGGIGTADSQLTHIDIWGANVYRGSSFYNLFNDFTNLSGKAFWISEFGIDAFHTVSPVYAPGKGYEDQSTQAQWDGNLWDEIALAYNANKTIGGNVFVYSDSWWQPYQWICGDNSHFCNSEQNHFGTGPSVACNGSPIPGPPFPDQFNHVEWFGMVSISANSISPFSADNVTPRQVYYTLQQKWQ